jgi:TPP-dependent pyruvate/acetoin dehydrogenase alpha subunit
VRTPPISPDLLGRELRLYRRLYLARRAEEAVRERYAEDEMKTPVHLSIGQEAIPVGVCEALEPRDRLLASYRNHALYLARTGDTDGFFGELYGRASGAARGKAGSMHLASPDQGLLATSAVVASTIPVALGVAWACRMRGDGARTVVFFGDGAVDEGVFWESLNFACLRRLPLLFVCEDNALAIHSRSRDRHGYDSIAAVAERFRCEVYASDSTDPGVIADLTREALARMQAEEAPAFLHLRCYRFVEHVGIEYDRNFHFPYRPAEEYAHWWERDSLALVRRRLRAACSEQQLHELESEVERQIEESIRKARSAPFPEPRELYDGVHG